MIKKKIVQFFPRNIQELFKFVLIADLTMGKNMKIEATWNILKKGDDIIKIYDKPKAVIFLGSDNVSTIIPKLITNNVDARPTLIDDSRNSAAQFSPQVIMDQSTDEFLYYNVPGFSNDSDSSMEIASIYFLKEIIDRVKALKFVLIVDYGEKNVENFVNLMKRTSEFIKNIDDFNESISLVVINAKETDSKNNIVDILTSEKDKMQQNVNATKLFDIFIKNHSKLDIFREENSTIKQMIDNENFTFIANDDFKYDISESARGRIFKMIQKINDDVFEAVGSLMSTIKNHYIAKQKEFYDIKDIDNILLNASRIVEGSIKILNSDKILPLEFGEKLEDLFIKLGIPLAQSDLIKITTQNRRLEFLRTFNPNLSNLDSLYWTSPLNELFRYLEDSFHWSSFLLRTRERLMNYEVRRDEVKYNPKRLNDILSTAESRAKKTMRGENLRYFFKEIYGRNSMLGYDSIRNLEMDETRLKMIRTIINSSFDDDKTIECDAKSNELLIKGNFLKTSEIQWDSCQGVGSVKIFATQVIYINSDIEGVVNGKQLTIISPTWDIIGTRRITMNASKFFGMGYDFLNSNDLTVTSTGNSLKNFIELNKSSSVTFNGQFITETIDFQHSQVAAINQYKIYQINKLHDLIDKTSTIVMNQELYTNDKILRLYDFQGFIDEILNLEKNFQYDFNANPVQSYESLLKRINNYYREMESAKKQIPINEDIVLKYAFTLCSSKIWSLKNNLNNNLIIHIEDYLDQVLSNLKELKNNEKMLQVKVYVHNYKNTIEFEINDLLQFMNQHILPYIESTEKRINEEIKVLIDEVRQMQADKRTNIHDLKIKQRKMEKAFRKKSFLKVLSGIGKVVSFFGPVGQMVGGIMNAGTSIAGNFITQPDGSIMSKLKTVPDGVKTALESIERFRKEREEKKREALIKKITILQETKDPELTDIVNQLISIRNNSTGQIDPKKVEEIFKKAQQDLEKKATTEEKKTHLKKTIELFHKVQAYAPIVDVVKDLYSDAREHKQEMKEISDAIKANEQQINQLELFKHQIDEVLISGFTETQSYVGNVTANLSKGVRVPMVERWNLQQQVSLMKKQMQRFSDGFTVNVEIMDCWDKIDNALDHLINAYDQIQDLQKDKNLSDLIAEVGSKSIDASLPTGLEEHLMKMVLLTQYNVVYGKYNRIVRALKQATFPFADFYFWLDKFPGNVDSVEYMIASINEKLTSLKSTLAEARTSTIKPNHLTYLAEFSSRSVLKNPFYLWENQEHRNLIGKLLNGEEVILVADITKSQLQNAIKFNKIELLLNAKNQTVQNEIDSLLSTFEIQMLHSGVSRYKCDDRVYTFVSNPQSLSHSYAQSLSDFSAKGNPCFGVPAVRKETYDKLNAAKPILSPYTAWTIRLKNLRHTGYNDLLKYQDEVDLELAGTGSYVDDEVKICKDQLLDQYAIDRDFSEKLYLRESTSMKSYSNRRARSAGFIEESHQEFESMATGSKNFLGKLNYYGIALLLELFTRKCTGQKPKFFGHDRNESRVDDALIKSINVVDQFERELEKLFSYHQMEGITFDSCDLVSQFKSNLLNGSEEQCCEILRKSMKLKGSMPNMDEFCRDLDNVIKKIVQAEIKLRSQ